MAGFFHRSAVVDPEKPGRYLLGIECDGATYHSSRSARDRDRLRQQVLEDHGWILHRIWSTDWFRDPEGQVRKALEAVENAKMEWTKRGNPVATPGSPPIFDEPSPSRETICRENTDCGVDGHSLLARAQPYTEAASTNSIRFPVMVAVSSFSPHRPPTPGTLPSATSAP